MITLYDYKGEKHPISQYEDYSITHKKDGEDTMTFYLDVRSEQHSLLFEEAVIVDDVNRWIIKKIDDDKVDCVLDLDELKKNIYLKYESGFRTLSHVITTHLPQGWKCVGADQVTFTAEMEISNVTDYDIIFNCQKTFGVYLSWDTINKIVYVYVPDLMLSTGEYVTSELNLKKLSLKGESTKLITRLYAYGKDGMTMSNAVVDGQTYGKSYVDNTSYVNKIISAVWKDEKFTDPTSLYNAASKKLAGLAFPNRSYECVVVDLAKLNPMYSFLDFKIHKKVTLIDIDRDIKVEHSIVEYKEYPDHPVDNKITLSVVLDTIKQSISKQIQGSAEDAAIKFNGDLTAVDASVAQLKTDVHSLTLQVDDIKAVPDYAEDNLNAFTKTGTYFVASKDCLMSNGFPVDNETGFLKVVQNDNKNSVMQEFTSAAKRFYRLGNYSGGSLSFNKWYSISSIEV